MDVTALVDVLIRIVESQKLTDAQRHEIVGRFVSAVLSMNPEQKASHVAPVPEPPKGSVIIPQGAVFTCTSCKQPTLETIAPVYQTMKLSEFRAAFRPELDVNNSVWADPEGNAAVNCPSCRGEKTVWIKGKVGVYKEIPDGESQGLHG